MKTQYNKLLKKATSFNLNETSLKITNITSFQMLKHPSRLSKSTIFNSSFLNSRSILEKIVVNPQFKYPLLKKCLKISHSIIRKASINKTNIFLLLLYIKMEQDHEVPKILQYVKKQSPFLFCF